ncbi:DHHC zinc finger domain protein [Ostertagia ostertagi]
MKNVCKEILRGLDAKVDSFCATYLEYFNKAVGVLGVVLVFTVYIITVFITFTSFAIILPYEQMYKSTLLVGFIMSFGVYLLVNIVFHYGKARKLTPMRNSGKQGDRWCEKCNFFKGERTHHCAMCDRCIVGMDHHCIWINQCVGSHNHRHFFFFIFYLTSATLTIILFSFNTAYDHIFMTSSSKNFCSSSLPFAPLQPFICSQEDLARNAVTFCYLISILLFLFVGFLFLWNCFLISTGCTYIDYMRRRRNGESIKWRIAFNKKLLNNWKRFLGLHRNRSFFRHIMLPCTHPPIYPDSSESVIGFYDVV